MCGRRSGGSEANPGKYSLGYTTSTPQMTGELFRIIAGINLLFVPYKTSAAAYTDLNTGQLDAMLETVISSRPQIKAGRMKAIAVTSARRSVLMPEIPTIAESGYPKFKTQTWNGLLARKGTPQEVIDKVAQEIVRAAKDPKFVEPLARYGADALGNTPDEFAKMIASDVALWAEAVEVAGMKQK